MRKLFAVLLTALFFCLGSAYAQDILVYDGGGPHSQSEIVDAVTQLGYTPAVSTPTPGNRLLDLTLSNYDAVVIGWNWDGDTTGIANPSDGNALDAIDGNILLTGHDAGLHVVHGYDLGTGGDVVEDAASTFLSQAIIWASSCPGTTGLVALGDYSTAFSYLPAAWGISATGGLNRETVFGPTVAGAASGVCNPGPGLPPGDVDAGMSNWGQSYHARFDSWDTSRFVAFEVGEFGDIVTIGTRAFAPPNTVIAITCGGDMLISGNSTVQGDFGSVHANNNLTISGTSTTIAGDATASGIYSISGGSPSIGGIATGGVPQVYIPPIDPEDYRGAMADYELWANGDVYDSNGNHVGSNSFNGWTWGGSKWTFNSNDTFPGTYYIEGDAVVSGSPGSLADPWKVTIAAKESIKISGSPKMEAYSCSDVLLVAGRDLKINGNPGQLYIGYLLVHEQVDIGGGPTLEGAIIAEDAENISGLVNQNEFSGSMIITYD